MEGIKKILGTIVFIAAIIAAVVMLLSNPVEHIEDTNGADNYELQTITDEDIVNMEMGAKGYSVTTHNITKTTEISSGKFTGVHRVVYSNLLGASDFVLNIRNFKVKRGNFKMVVVHDGEIVDELTAESAESYVLEDVNGTVSLVIAGESADFSFEMSTFDYDMLEHD